MRRALAVLTMGLLAGISACGVARVAEPTVAANVATVATPSSSTPSGTAVVVTVPALSSSAAAQQTATGVRSTAGSTPASTPATVTPVITPTTQSDGPGSSPTTSTSTPDTAGEDLPATTTAAPTTSTRPSPAAGLNASKAPTTAAPTTPPSTKAVSTTTKAAPTTTAKSTSTSTAPSTTKPTTAKPTTTQTPPLPFAIPVSVGNATQVITVVASSSSATTAVLTAWQRGSNGVWKVALGPYQAWVGSDGIGTASEYSSHTPKGTFTLTEAFGQKADPGTALPYHQTNPNDWWVSDVNSKYYNTMQNCVKSACPFNTSVSEHLYYEVPYYNYAVVMDVNRWPAVPGAGSAFFLHVTDQKPTAGCVAVAQTNLLAIMRWLDPAQHPRIADGIG